MYTIFPEYKWDIITRRDIEIVVNVEFSIKTETSYFSLVGKMSIGINKVIYKGVKQH